MGYDGELFASEAALVERILELLPAFLTGRAHRHVLAVEVGVGRAIADVVAAVWEGPLVQPPGPLSAHDSVLLAALRRGGPTRIDLLEARCGVAPGGFRNGALRNLIASGLLTRGSGGQVALANEWATRVRIVAVEAKLQAWRGAISQAARYLGYADESYVALPACRAIRAAEHLSFFRAANVGLLSIGSKLEVALHASTAAAAHDWRREFAASRVLTAG